ncbi:hypothetical protein CONLIGDRAFT_680932 [Coniochaeta ligniaria NRRL 30616]|uniref:Peptidase M1 membrane alanine aminopeptidase domain-containing protein n=1 Tax=Coniochaeta ligniaria NRRL 30616 TaxID=1408157 RepID=A0A1J7IR69_9PEZI|nr:hypothetical protein CONLIGDRAFT_680932 [Coniochaeta ligniaria NRRL 30616]
MNEFFPDWKVWHRYVANDLQAALALDSLRSSHPVERIVRDAKDAKQMYDEIPYQKGCCVLKMVLNDVLTMAGETLTIPVPGGSRWAKINANHHRGFFVWAYTPNHLRQLFKATSKDDLTVRDCVGLSCDQRRLVVAGISKTSDLLELIARFRYIGTHLV